VFGSVKREQILSRAGANPGDLIAVTGSLGGSAAGFKILQQKLQFDSEADSALRKAHLRPYPKITAGQILGQNGVKAAIDLSDGLFADLTQVCQSSQVSARVFAESIPLHPAVKDYFPEEASSLALTGGEDYELLFTAPKEIIEKVKQATSFPITIIGEVTARKPGIVTVLNKDGKEIDPPKKGWEHFGHRS